MSGKVKEQGEMKIKLELRSLKGRQENIDESYENVNTK